MQSLSAAQTSRPVRFFNFKQLAVLRAFLDSLSTEQHKALARLIDDRPPADTAEAAAKRVKAIRVYLSQLRGGHRKASPEFAMKLADASGGRLRPCDVRPDLTVFAP